MLVVRCMPVEIGPLISAETSFWAGRKQHLGRLTQYQTSTAV